MHIGRAQELVADLPPSQAKTFVLTVAAGNAMVAGEDDKAYALATEVVRLGESLDAFGEVSNRRWLRGQLHFPEFALGNWEAALRATDSFLGERERLGAHYLEHDQHETRAMIRLARWRSTRRSLPARSSTPKRAQRPRPPAARKSF
jgi:hypothetical protein